MENQVNHLKISILTSESSWGGMGAHTVGLAKILESRGHEVLIVEPGSDLYRHASFGRDEKIKNIRIIIGKHLSSLNFWTSLGLLRKMKGDVCIFSKGGLYVGNWQLDLAARLMFSRYITIEHLDQPLSLKLSRRYIGGLLPGLGLYRYKEILNGFLRSLWPHRVVCVSDIIRKRFIDNYHFPEKKITTVLNGIDTKKFQPRTDYRIAARNTWGISHDALIFGSIGRLSSVKAYDLALELFSRLISSAPSRDVWFVLIGDGPESEALKLLAEKLGVKEKVRFLGFSDKPWEIYPAFDVFIMPSRNEGLPLALLEAMACGCCPVAMGVGGIPEIISDPSLGLIVKPNDQLAFFEAMKKVTEIDLSMIVEMGLNARERVALNFEARTQFLALATLIEREVALKI